MEVLGCISIDLIHVSSVVRKNQETTLVSLEVAARGLRCRSHRRRLEAVGLVGGWYGNGLSIFRAD